MCILEASADEGFLAAAITRDVGMYGVAALRCWRSFASDVWWEWRALGRRRVVMGHQSVVLGPNAEQHVVDAVFGL